MSEKNTLVLQIYEKASKEASLFKRILFFMAFFVPGIVQLIGP